MYDQIVIGAGIIGSWTAHHLARDGNKVLLLEQFPLPSTRGSSTGQTRNFHSIEKYQPIIEKAEQYFKELSNRHGGNLFLKDGRLQIGQKTGAVINAHEKQLKEKGLELEVLEGGKGISKRFPQFRFDDRYRGVFEPNAYTIMAAKTLGFLQSEFKEAGGTIMDGCKVTDIQSTPTWVRVITGTGSYFAKGVAICVGPWAVKFLAKMNLHPQIHTEAIACTYWREKKPGSHALWAGFPQFSCRPEVEIYGVPSLEYPGLIKIAYHGGEPADPDSRDATVNMDKFINPVKDFIKEHMPGINPEPEIVEPCMYTWTSDHRFIADFHPRFSNVVIGAGFCGSGFQISGGVGRMLADMLTGKEMTIKINMDQFSLKRFSSRI